MGNNFNRKEGAIGVFDSGYGGLTILSEIRSLMPHYDYIYLGDNARAPYGTALLKSYIDSRYKRSNGFSQGCHLIILACNTASAKALRSIQKTISRFLILNDAYWASSDQQWKA